MEETLNQLAKQKADEIIAMSVVLKDKMESWADVCTRIPDSQNVNVTAGFITNWTRQNVIEVLVEACAPADADKALLRIQAIETIKDDQENERFNQVSLHFVADYAQARELVEKGGATTREDIAALLHSEASQLSSITVSDQTGRDSATQELLGKRYEYEADGLVALAADAQNELVQAANTVLAKLKQTAEQQAAS